MNSDEISFVNYLINTFSLNKKHYLANGTSLSNMFLDCLNELPLITLVLFISNCNISLILENGVITGIEEGVKI